MSLLVSLVVLTLKLAPIIFHMNKNLLLNNKILFQHQSNKISYPNNHNNYNNQLLFLLLLPKK